MSIPTRRLRYDTEHALERCPMVAREARFTRAGQALRRITFGVSAPWSWR